jgi:putative phage-type endonuclease
MTALATDPDQVADWLAWRRQGIGASDVAGILGVSRFTSPWAVWADKLGLTPPDTNGTEAMEAGHFLELAIGPWFEHRTGLTVAAQQLQLEADDWPVARATLDGLVFEPERTPDGGELLRAGVPLGGIEMKLDEFGLAFTRDEQANASDAIPAYYQCQAQWQMYVAGLERVWFAVWIGRGLRIFELTRDDDDIEFITTRAREWWDRYVIGGDEPPVDSSDATTRALAAVYPTEEPGTATDLDGDLIDRWRAAKADEKAATETAKALANEVRAALGDTEVGTVAGTPVVTWKAQTKRGLDLDGIRANHPRIAAKYSTETVSRVLRDKRRAPKGT